MCRIFRTDNQLDVEDGRTGQLISASRLRVLRKMVKVGGAALGLEER